MKLIICIIQDSDKDNVIKGLNEEGFRVTVMPSTGAYFRRGNTTLMIGVEDELVQSAITCIKNHTAEPSLEGLKRATLFVLPVAHFEQV